MTTRPLAPAAIAGYAYSAGFRGDDLVTAVAVALAESGGRADAVGDVALQDRTWGPSVGLWQIRSMKIQHGTGRTRDQVANMDPATNARHAYQVWRESSWSAWSTWTHNTYRAHQAIAAAAVRVAGHREGGNTDTNWGWLDVHQATSLATIAANYKLTVAELRTLNPDLVGDTVSAGRHVKVRSQAGPYQP